MQCIQILEDGNQCSSHSLKDSKYCFFHDPKKSSERKAAQAKGGQVGNRKVLDESNFDGTFGQTKDLLAGTVNDVLTGTIDIETAKTVGSLIKTLIKLYK